MKDSRLEIRLSVKEKEIIREKAKELGYKNVSDYILSSVLKGIEEK